MNHTLIPWTAQGSEIWEKSSSLTIADFSIRDCIGKDCSGKYYTSAVVSMDNAAFAVRAVNNHEELLGALKVALSYLGKGQADGLFDNCSVPGEKLLANIQETIARAESR